MKPSKIFSVLDLARNARKIDEIFNPLFVGAPGVGKSSVVQAWCKENNLPFIDLRAAYLEAPDIIGFPSITVKEGRQITTHNLPDFWPTKGEGVLLLEEPNRGTTSVMNTFMQLLTDRKIHQYNLPPGWIIVAAINPENEHYDVNTMDAALKNRFEIYDVEYDQKSFVEYMKQNNWDKTLILWVENRVFQYTSPEKLAATPGNKYVSPRTLQRLNTILKTGYEKEDEFLHFETILGANQGKSFYAFKNNERPVLYKDLVDHKKESLKRLALYSDPNNYKNAQISITIKDILENPTIEEKLLVDVLLAIPADQGPFLLRELEFVRKEPKLTDQLLAKHPELKKYLKDTLV
jgi:MoxR-like ATPase